MGLEACGAGGGDSGSCQCAPPDEAGFDAQIDVRDEITADATSDERPEAMVDATSDARGDADSGSCSWQGTDAGAGGTVAWAENFGLTGMMYPAGVTIAPATGDVAVTGGFTGTVNFGGGVFASAPGFDAATPGYYMFIAVFDACGAYKWARAFGNGADVGAAAVAVDGEGRVAVAGIFQGSVSLGGAPLTAVGFFDVFVAEYDSTGTYLWAKSFGSFDRFQGLASVAVDGSGNVILGGIAQGGVSFGGPALTGYFMAKFDPTGGYLWSKAIPENSAGNDESLVVDPSGDVILAGGFTGPTDFGGGTLTPPSSGSAFVAKYDPSGSYLWARQYPETVDGGTITPAVASGGLAVDGAGNILVSGDFDGTIDLGSGQVTAAGGPNHVFLAKISGTGSGMWADEFDGDMSAGLLASDGAGGVTLAAQLGSGAVDLGGGMLTGGGAGSMVFAGFDAAGVFRWSRSGGPPSTATSWVNGVAGSATRGVIVGTFGCPGTCQSPATLALGSTTLSAVSNADLFVASYVP